MGCCGSTAAKDEAPPEPIDVEAATNTDAIAVDATISGSANGGVPSALEKYRYTVSENGTESGGWICDRLGSSLSFLLACTLSCPAPLATATVRLCISYLCRKRTAVATHSPIDSLLPHCCFFESFPI
jgi:hypothetical protein